jgi:TonB family protein
MKHPLTRHLPRDRDRRVIFPGWGPRLFTTAIVAAGLAFAAIPGAGNAAEDAACPRADQPAAVISAAIPELPDTSSMTSYPSLPVSATIRVDLDASGGLLGSSVVQGTGNISLDREALRAVHSTRFSPEMQRCLARAGSYLYVVNFTE